MTSPELGLLPARSDDRLPALTAAQLAASGYLEFAQRCRTEVRQGMSLEPGPQVFDGVEVGGVAGKKRHLNRTLGTVEVLAHDATLVLGCTVPDDQQLSLELRPKGLQELHDLRALDRTVVQAEQEIRAGQASDCRDVLPVEVELHDRRASLERPGAHPRWPFRQARF